MAIADAVVDQRRQGLFATPAPPCRPPSMARRQADAGVEPLWLGVEYRGEPAAPAAPVQTTCSAPPRPVKGADVAGTIGGQPVIGAGQTLTGAPGSPAEGLKIEVTGGTIGSRGTVSFSQGYAYQLNNLATVLPGHRRPDHQPHHRPQQKRQRSSPTQRDEFSDKLTDIEARYRAQYSRLDVTLSKMTTTQSLFDPAAGRHRRQPLSAYHRRNKCLEPNNAASMPMPRSAWKRASFRPRRTS